MAKRGGHGISNLHIYPIENGAYNGVVIQPGARALTRNITQEITKFYADDGVHDQIVGVKVIEGEITLYQIEEEFYTKFLGYIKEDNGALTDGGSNSAFGMSYAVKTRVNGQDAYKIVTLYDNVATEPAVENTTDEEAVTLSELVIPFSGKVSDFVFNKEGNRISYMVKELPVGTSETDIANLLGAGIPLPTSEFVLGNATGLITTVSPSVDGVAVAYEYHANDELIADATLDVYLTSDLNTSIVSDVVAEGASISVMTGLSTGENYTVILKQGIRILAEKTFTTL